MRFARFRAAAFAAFAAFAAALPCLARAAEANEAHDVASALESSPRAAAASRYLARDAALVEVWRRQRPGTTPPEPTYSPALTFRPNNVAATAALAHRPFHREIVKAAERAGIDPLLVHAVIRVESAYNARAVSPRGAVGLMQVIPGTGRRFGVEDLLQPSANITAGTQYLSHLMRIFEGDLRLALAAYNAGENAVLRYGRRIPPYRETMGYVPRVLETYRALSALRRAEGDAGR